MTTTATTADIASILAAAGIPAGARRLRAHQARALTSAIGRAIDAELAGRGVTCWGWLVPARPGHAPQAETERVILLARAAIGTRGARAA